MAGEEVMEPFMGVKVRRRSSMFRNFSADYIDVPSNPSLMKLLQKQGLFLTLTVPLPLVLQLQLLY